MKQACLPTPLALKHCHTYHTLTFRHSTEQLVCYADLLVLGKVVLLWWEETQRGFHNYEI